MRRGSAGPASPGLHLSRSIEDDLYLHPVELPPEIEEYYEGFSNDTLWPIYHDVIVQATFHRHWWNTYRTINDRFAQAIAGWPRRVPPCGCTTTTCSSYRRCCGRSGPTCASDGSTTYPSRRSSFAQLPWRGALVRGCWARTSWASSAPPMPRTSCVPAAGCWACPPKGDTVTFTPPGGDAAPRTVRVQRHPDLGGLPGLCRRWPSTPRSSPARPRSVPRWVTPRSSCWASTDSTTPRASGTGSRPTGAPAGQGAGPTRRDR